MKFDVDFTQERTGTVTIEADSEADAKAKIESGIDETLVNWIWDAGNTVIETCESEE